MKVSITLLPVGILYSWSASWSLSNSCVKVKAVSVIEMTSLIRDICNKHKIIEQESFLSRSSQEMDEQNVYEVLTVGRLPCQWIRYNVLLFCKRLDWLLFCSEHKINQIKRSNNNCIKYDLFERIRMWSIFHLVM